MTHLTDEQLNDLLDARHPTPVTLTRHLDTCDKCRARLEELRTAIAMLASLPEVRPPHDLTNSILARLPQKQKSPAWNWLIAAQIATAFAISAWLASTFKLPAAILAYQPPTLDSLVASILAFVSSISLELPTFDLQPLKFHLQSPTFNPTLLVASAAALWIIGNGILFRTFPPKVKA